jgi:hypothetical protein
MKTNKKYEIQGKGLHEADEGQTEVRDFEKRSS